MANPHPWFPFDGQEFLVSTYGWPAAAVGAYITLLAAAWVDDGLPDEPEALRLIARVDRRDWPEIWSLLSPKWQCVDGRLRDAWLEQVRARPSISALARIRRVYGIAGESVRQRDGDVCRYCGQSVAFGYMNPAGGTFDHVVPDGPATVQNLVVACRGCNSRKGHRTPEQAGMRLRPWGLT